MPTLEMTVVALDGNSKSAPMRSAYWYPGIPPRIEVELVNVVEVNVAFGQYGSVDGPEKNCAINGTVSNWPQK